MDALKKLLFSIMLILVFSQGWGITLAEKNTTTYLESIRTDQKKLQHFFYLMPKGGDIHSHLSGAMYVENIMHYPGIDKFCLDRNTLIASIDKNCDPSNYLTKLYFSKEYQTKILESWTMLNFPLDKKLGNKHFFNAFEKFSAISSTKVAYALAEVADRAAKQNVHYLELMFTPGRAALSKLCLQIAWNNNFSQMQLDLEKGGLDKLTNEITKSLDIEEKIMRKSLQCDTKKAMPGCKVKIRYLYQVLREQQPTAVFAQLLMGFKLAEHDARFIGFNMVQAEYGKIALRDYSLHMKIIAYLHQKYPQVQYSLHAGELVPQIADKHDLSFHIHDAVFIADAKRIGHGVDIKEENESAKTLKYMAANHILVEVPLSSNYAVLGVKGKQHQITTYLENNVPVALVTDDEGILRTNISNEFLVAANTFHFPYLEMKQFARNSITYSFLPGNSLWQDAHNSTLVDACHDMKVGKSNLSKSCQLYLNSNEKAQQQWQLEKEFIQFESQF